MRPPSAPKIPPGVRRLFRLPWSRARMLRELDDEVRFHLEMRVAELRERGLSDAEAQAEAHRRFGDADALREYCANVDARRARRVRLLAWLGAWKQDVRFAMRQFRKTPAFTAIAILTLALGIGANTAIFSVVHRLLLAPLPYPDGNRIVKLVMNDAFASTPDRSALRIWQARAHSLEMIAGVSIDAILVDSREEQDTVHAFITANYLQLLGIHPALGREFTPEDERPGGAAVAMISYQMWQQTYGGRRDVLGKTIDVDGRPRMIVAVAPRNMGLAMSHPVGFRMQLHEATPGIWIPAPLDKTYDLFAKLRPGVSAQDASRELAALIDTVPGSAQNRAQPRAMRAQDFLDPHEARAVEVLFVAVGVLLLIACANVANLLLSRAWSRRREFGVRVALGAGRARLARQMLTESVLLALAGGILGVGIAWVTLEAILALHQPALENLDGVHIEMAVLLWSAAISIATGILFGCAPALFASARSVGDVLRSESRTGAGNIASRRLRSTLIVLEIAMSLVLLIGAGLLVRSFIAMQQIPLGFDPHGLMEIETLPRPRMTAEERRAQRATVLEHLRAVPGVIDAAVGTLPDDPYGMLAGAPKKPDANEDPRNLSRFGVVFMSPNYFHVAGMSLIEGRMPDSVVWARMTDRERRFEVPQEVVVNHAFARRIAPDGRAIGVRLGSGGGGPPGTRETYVVVGVVNDVHMPGPRDPIKDAVVYELPWLPASTFLVRAAPSSASRIAASMRRIMAEADPRIFVRTVLTGDRYLSDALAPTRFAMALLATFAIIALVLSAVGLYGVIAYSVTQRTREIGVRIALGAQTADIARLVLGEGIRLAAIGVVLGVAGAIAATRALRGMLYGVGPTDPLTFVVIALVLAGVALVASYVPARRALRIDPTEALRAE